MKNPLMKRDLANAARKIRSSAQLLAVFLVISGLGVVLFSLFAVMQGQLAGIIGIASGLIQLIVASFLVAMATILSILATITLEQLEQDEG